MDFPSELNMEYFIQGSASKSSGSGVTLYAHGSGKFTVPSFLCENYTSFIVSLSSIQSQSTP